MYRCLINANFRGEPRKPSCATYSSTIEFMFCFFPSSFNGAGGAAAGFILVLGINTITGSSDLLEASYRKFHWKLIIGVP